MPDRRHPRLPLALEVEYRTAGAFLVAFSVNLSKGGLFLETEQPAPVGTTLSLRFSVPGCGPITVHGVVMWTRGSGQEGKPPGMGVAFEDLDRRHGETIDRVALTFQGLRVLVVAGNQSTRTLLARTIRSCVTTAEVIEAGNAEHADAALARADLAVVDLDSAEESSLLALRLAKTSVGRNLPVIALSREAEARARAVTAGADEAMPTAPSVADLQQAIVRVISRPLRVT